MQSLTEKCTSCCNTPTVAVRDHLITEMFPVEQGFSLWLEQELLNNQLCTHCVCINASDIRNGAWMRNSAWNPQAAKALNAGEFYGVTFKVCHCVQPGHVALHLCNESEYQGNDYGPDKSQTGDRIV